MLTKINSNKINYEKYGNSKNTILILPGWGNTRETFNTMIEELKENNTIYIIDYPGFGKSPISKETLTIYDYANIIEKLIKKLKIKNPTIIAHSFGGRLASILIGSKRINCNKLILIDVAGIRRFNLKRFLKEKLYKLLKKCTNLLSRKAKEKTQQKLFKHFSSSDYKELSPIMRKTFQNIIKEDLTKYYKSIKTETLIIWGELDEETPLKDGKKIHKIIKNSGLIIFPKANHFPYLNYPILFNKIIKEFTKKSS